MLHIEPRHPAPIEIHKSSASDRSVRSMAQRAKDTLSPCAKQQEKNAENATGLSVRKMMPILKLALEMTHTPIDDVMGRPIAKDFALPGGKTRRMTEKTKQQHNQKRKSTMKLSQVVTTAVSAVLVVSLLGCASIIDGGRKTVNIKSQPSGAKATVYDKKGVEVATGQTPALFPLKRSGGYFTGAKYRIVIEKEGYKNAEVEVKSTINGWYFGNFVFGGLLGLLIIDPATGAMWTLSPKDVDKVLDAGNAAITKEAGGMVVMLRQDVPFDLVRSLQPLTSAN